MYAVKFVHFLGYAVIGSIQDSFLIYMKFTKACGWIYYEVNPLLTF